MKISIQNFKSIKDLQNFEIKPFTIIAGVNSSGKSSFIQLLLLLKQTIELNSSNQPFYLDGELYKVREFKDIIYNKDLQNRLGVSFGFNKGEVSRINSPDMRIFNHHDNFETEISLQFDFLNETIIVRDFGIRINLPEGIKDQIISCEFNVEGNYSIDTNTAFFGEGLWNDDALKKVIFLSFYPLYYEKKVGDILEKEFLKIDWAKTLINSFFNNITYIGPLREQPKDEYSFLKSHKNVGTKGEFVAQILEEHADERTHFYRIIEQESGIIYKNETKSLTDVVKYWMCEVFDVTEDIHTEKINETYKIVLKNKSGLSTSIKHVGFGISQLLPIIVEGLRMPNDGTLILEQPEIHLHPKVQSLLFDFLYGLTLQGKTVIVETHSSHFITRMRRRIAEDESNKMDDHINLTFIENDIFRTIELDDYGTLNYFPKDFIEQSNTELRAIVKAQMNKRAKNK